MQQAKARLEALIKESDAFNFSEMGNKSQYGNLSDLIPEWIDWTIRADALVLNLFGPQSMVYKRLHGAITMTLVGNGPDQFRRCKQQLVGTLQAAKKMVDDLPEQSSQATAPGALSNRVFIVHGHDEKNKGQLEAFLIEMGLEPVVLHRQPDEGKTIIEKFEKHSDVGYALILLTPDDIAFPASQEQLTDAERKFEPRARPNVIFEFGYFVGRLGRANVCCLHTGNVVLPSDVQGVIYKSFTNNVEEVAYSISKELKARGYQLK
jgi:predicted nucleotide-binding protein